jgi:hypothetical protein
MPKAPADLACARDSRPLDFLACSFVFINIPGLFLHFESRGSRS